MTKSDIVTKIAADTGTTKVTAAKALAAFLGSITEALRKGEKVSIAGFGSFSVLQRKARKGKNPQTGKALTIPAKTTPKFTAGKSLKDVL